MSEHRSVVTRAPGKRWLIAASLALVAAAGLAIPAFVTRAQGAAPAKPALLEEKQTPLGLYVTAKEAYAMLQANPEVKLIDVRTPEEYALIGHPTMAWDIPLGFITYQRVDGKFEHGVRMNPDFVAEVQKLAKPSDTILLMCRSGGRSAMAVKVLAKAGFTKAYTVTDGFEGDKVEDPDSVFIGERMRNGWKNSALPWIYSIDPEKVVIAECAAKEPAAKK